ncbi:OmpA family protein [Aquimarina sp. 2304DJ70-9]|uniref:OmpA family protein n=1 Tax=Aquimarina penaris TaxID=3231044 RepID=UPI003463054F
MKNLISFIIFLLFAWLGMWWYYSCNWCLGNGNSTTIVESNPDPNTETLTKKAYEDSIANANKNTVGLFVNDDQGNELFTFKENLEINRNNGNVLIPNSVNGFSDQIVEYLGKHQDQELVISGYENSSEREKSTNFGISRANFIKEILIEAGVNGDRIVTKPTLEDYNYNNDTGNYIGGIHLDFHKPDESRLAEIEKGVANKLLYSKFAQKTFTPDATLANYTLELKNYIEKYPDKTIQIIGHTDNVGEEEANIWYGQERANNVMNYLISQGITKDKIKASSKGESSPIAPNDSDENKAKNRRIEIIVN